MYVYFDNLLTRELTAYFFVECKHFPLISRRNIYLATVIRANNRNANGGIVFGLKLIIG